MLFFTAARLQSDIYATGNPICNGASAGGTYCLVAGVCVRVFGAREGAFVYPKLDFGASVIEFQARRRWVVDKFKDNAGGIKDIALPSTPVQLSVEKPRNGLRNDFIRSHVSSCRYQPSRHRPAFSESIFLRAPKMSAPGGEGA